MITILIVEYLVFFGLLILLKISKQNKIQVSLKAISATGFIFILFVYVQYLYNKQSIKEHDGIVTSSGRIYELKEGLKPGDKIYIDRNYQFVKIPPDIADEEFVQTSNEDKLSKGNNFLKITLLYPAVIYVGFDIRGPYKELNWLSEYNFQLTKDTLVSSDTKFILYKKEFDKCPSVVLGGNVLPGSTDTVSMYTIVIDHDYQEKISGGETCDKKIEIDTAVLRKSLPFYVKSESPGSDLSTQELINRIIKHSQWYNTDNLTNKNRADFSQMDLSHVKMMEVNLSYADLRRSNLDSADIVGIKLSYSEMMYISLIGASIQRADLSNADLMNADLREAHLNGANLHNANLSETNLEGTELTLANLSGTVFEPSSLPDVRAIANADSLSYMKYNNFPDALYKLRKNFDEEGYRFQAKEITAAIEKEKTNRAGFFEKYFRTVFFEITCSYGLKTGKPLLLIIGFMFFFYPLYVFALVNMNKDSLMKIYSDEEKELLEKIKENSSGKFFQSVFHFSMLNAFSMGWNDFQIGNWISNIQSKQYRFQAAGVTRSLSGIQALISFYLLVLWALTYFGNPFV